MGSKVTTFRTTYAQSAFYIGNILLLKLCILQLKSDVSTNVKTATEEWLVHTFQISSDINPYPWLNRPHKTSSHRSPQTLKMWPKCHGIQCYWPWRKLEPPNVIFAPFPAIGIMVNGNPYKGDKHSFSDWEIHFIKTLPQSAGSSTMPSQRLSVTQACSWFILPAMLLPTLNTGLTKC